MKTSGLLGTVAVALCTLLGVLEPQAALAQRYVVTCLQNRTDVDFNYSYRWGSADWGRSVVRAGGYRWHSYPYDEAYRSAPMLEVSFDYDGSNGVRYKTYQLQRYSTYADDCGSGKQYYFSTNPSGDYDLFDPDLDRNTNYQAPTQYAVTCIENKTDMNLSYIFRWGNGQWQTYSLNPWNSTWHAWPYTRGARTAPVPQLKFDYDLASGSQDWQYDLAGYTSRSQSCNGAKNYYFGRYGDNMIDLYDPDKQAARLRHSSEPDRSSQPAETRGRRRDRRVTVGIPPRR